ncbi:hypothetical protein OOT33_04515 [Sphingobium sp. DEHP117]|uniref:hypothetical protein n=1 Tax=Sphingobium sp. DEHP117 TaxID=2993436 RepID=UPI0027D72ACF|nr:hypothetical protein [Sphingobium sp. DEHP117]MDQ4419703.1 hypothetical protein [Sphingobium sp. DEHP117]
MDADDDGNAKMLASLKQRWEQGLISGEEYFIEKTRLVAVAAPVAGVVGADLAAQTSVISVGVKFAALSLVGSAAIGVSALGWYVLRAKQPAQSAVSTEVSSSREIDAAGSDEQQQNVPPPIPLGHIVTQGEAAGALPPSTAIDPPCNQAETGTSVVHRPDAGSQVVGNKGNHTQKC